MAMITDNSSGATAFGIGGYNSSQQAFDYNSTDTGAGFSGFLGRLFPKLTGYDEAREDYLNALDREYNAEQSQKQRDWSSLEAELTRQFNSVEAQKQRDWSAHMRDTAYQATVADMQKAGINPVLAFQQGASSAPGGSSASASAPGGSSASAFHRSSGSSGSPVGSLLSGALKIVAGLVTDNPAPVVSGVSEIKTFSNGKSIKSEKKYNY